MNALEFVCLIHTYSISKWKGSHGLGCYRHCSVASGDTTNVFLHSGFVMIKQTGFKELISEP